MNDYQLTNKYLTVGIKSAGAELTSIKANDDGYEYLWQGDPAIWKRHAPILFPIVGRLQDDSYFFQDKEYHMSQHGFARDMDWKTVSSSSTKLVLQIQSTEETLAHYPFKFSLQITYELNDRQLKVDYQVRNTDEKTMFFSIGGHPAFNADFASATVSADKATFDHYVLAGNYLNPQAIGQFDFSSAHQISRSDFAHDAIILKAPEGSTELTLRTDVAAKHLSSNSLRKTASVSINAVNLAFFGIWSKATDDAPFVALEPWWGVADTIDTNKKLADKLGIMPLAVNKEKVFHYSMRFL